MKYDHIKGCRYFGYEPVSNGVPRDNSISHEERLRRVERYSSDRLAIRLAGFAPEKFGVRSKTAALTVAAEIEAATGIEIRVFKHNYY